MRHPRTIDLKIHALCALAGSVFAAALLANGCAPINMVGGMAQNFEYQKKIEVPALYTDLANRECAILVDMSMGLMYEQPYLAGQLALGVGNAIHKNVEGCSVLNPEHALAWQYRTSNWSLLPYGDVAEALDVERLIIIDIYEYRLNPPGNRYEWEGVAAANVRVVEADENSFDPDTPAEEYNVIARFPDDQAVVAFNTPRDRIEAGLLLKFVQQVSWLFYDHIEPKYPDRYRPELDVE